MIRKYYEPTPLCRVSYYEMTDSVICIDKIVDIVTAQFEQTATEITGDCWLFDPTGMKNFNKSNYFSLVPNPASTELNIDLHMAAATNVTISILNAMGQTVRSTELKNATNQRITINTSDLSSGIYLVNLISEKGMITKKLIVNH
jgi:hypothetical protein